MKLVEFTRVMLPWRPGEKRVVPDEVAEKLIADGVAVARPSAFDQPQLAPKRRGEYRTRDLL